MELFTWLAIVFCISQSALFSGLNLAYFSIPKLRLEIEAKNNNKQAIRILKIRKDSNFLLTTILWGNVGINVLLTLMTDSVLTGVSSFIFSTFAITILGEIFPQAYFSRNALAIGYHLTPILRFYQILLFPLAKSSSFVLDKLLGHESIQYYKEKGLRELIAKHVESDEASDIDRIEGTGAINFLNIDDAKLGLEGESIVANSILAIDNLDDNILRPGTQIPNEDPFVRDVQSSGEKWVILTINDNPEYCLDADGFLRSVFFSEEVVSPLEFCHKPIISNNPEEPVGKLLSRFSYEPEYEGDNVIDNDVILLWTQDMKRIITGADILGQLMKGIAFSKGDPKVKGSK